MAQIDVSELMSDPDFVDQIQLITRKSKVNFLGENILEETSVTTVGSVQPASAKVIQRLPEALRVQDMSSFWLKGSIPVSGSNQYPSLLVFKGRRYQIQSVSDWSNFGAGYSEGVCVVQVPA